MLTTQSCQVSSSLHSPALIRSMVVTTQTLSSFVKSTMSVFLHPMNFILCLSSVRMEPSSTKESSSVTGGSMLIVRKQLIFMLLLGVLSEEQLMRKENAP